MEAVSPRTIWVTEMGYEVNLHILEMYAIALLEAPTKPSKEIFGNAETIESKVSMQKRTKKRDKFIRDASKKAQEIKENVMNLSGILASELKGLQPEAHISPVDTSSDSDSGKTAEFKRVERKRKPSQVPSPSSKKTRILRKKQQVVREPKKKPTPKRKQTPIIPTLNDLLNEVTHEGNLSNVNKLYHSFNNTDMETIEESIVLHLDIYKKFLIEVIDELPNDLYMRLEAKRLPVMELDKKLKVEALLVVHTVKSKEEINELISEAHQSVFASGHRQVSLMARRVKEIVEETMDNWDIFFVEKEKQEEKSRTKKTFKVY